ncbi:hypothetical protein ABPG74_003713 [Tetrahymena malaccensis]
MSVIRQKMYSVNYQKKRQALNQILLCFFRVFNLKSQIFRAKEQRRVNFDQKINRKQLDKLIFFFFQNSTILPTIQFRNRDKLREQDINQLNSSASHLFHAMYNKDQYQKLESNQTNTQKANQNDNYSSELARVCKEMDFYSEQLQVYINKHQNTDDMKVLNNMDEKIRLLLQLIQRVQSDTHKIQQDKIKLSIERAAQISNQISSKNSNTNTTFNPFKLANPLTLGDSYVVPQKQNQVPLFQLPAPTVTQQYSIEQKIQGKSAMQDIHQQELLAYQSQEQLSSNNNQERDYNADDYIIENQKKYQQIDSKEQIYKNNNNNNNNKFNKKRKQNEQFDDNFNKMNNKDILKSHMNDNVNEYEQIQKIQIQGTQPRLIQAYGSSKSSQQQQQLLQQQQPHFQLPNQNINSVNNQTYSQIQQQQLQQQTQIHSNQIQHNQNNYQLLQTAINHEESNFFNQKDQLNNNNNNSIQGGNSTLNNLNFQSNHQNLASNFNAVQIQGQLIKVYPNKTKSNHNLNSQSNSSSGSYSHSHSHSQQSKSLQTYTKNSLNNQMSQNQIDNSNEQISLNNQLSHHERAQSNQDNKEKFINYFPNQPNQQSQQQMSIQQMNQEQSAQIYNNQNFLMSPSEAQQNLTSDDQSIDLYLHHESFHEAAHQKNKPNIAGLSNRTQMNRNMMHHSKSLENLQKIKKQNLNNSQQHAINLAEMDNDNQNSNLIQSQDDSILKASDISMITLEQHKIHMSKSLGESDRNVGNNQSQNTFITDNERTKSSNNNSNFLSNSTTLNNMQSTINQGRQDIKICKKEEEYSEYENDAEESDSEQTPLANQDFKYKNEQMVQQNSKARAFDTRNVIKNLLTFLKKYLTSISIPQDLLAWQSAQADFREYINNYKGHDVKSSRSIIQNYPLVNAISEIDNDLIRQDLELRLQTFPKYPLNEQIKRINYFNSLVRRYSMTYLTVIMPQVIQKNGMFIQKDSIQRFSQLFLSYIKNPTSYLRIQS